MQYIFLILTLLISTVSANSLSPDGERLKKEHHFLFQTYLEQHTATFANPKAPQGKRAIKRILIGKPNLTTDGNFELPLPKGTGKVVQFFRYFELHGENLDQLSYLRLLPTSPGTNLHISAQKKNLYRIKVPSLPDPGNTPPVLRLAGSGKAVIKAVYLVSFSRGVSEKFDAISYTNLGHDQAPTRVTITLDPTLPLSIEGHTQLDRTKWFRYYGKATTLPTTMERWAQKRNFTPGRQIFKIAPSLERGYGNPRHIVLTEDPDNPGHPHPDFEKKLKPTTFRNLNQLYPKDYTFSMCLDEWPSFQSHHPDGRGTPRLEYFEQAAELAATYFKKQIEYSGRTATWWEVKNESSIKAEWSYHFTYKNGKKVDSWKHLADFHNLVADRVHQSTPQVKIGGPASAWMQLQAGNFGLWRNQARFMDLTKDHLDFYSHHFYEGTRSLGAVKRLPDGYNNYLLGRLETLLDMFQSHGRATDNVKPMLITEYGTLNVGISKAAYWERLRSYSAYLTRFMQRPDQIDLAVPFIFLASPWDPTSGQATFVPAHQKRYSNNLKDYKLTPCQHFFNLWRDFKGQYLDVSSPHRYLETVAARDGQTVYLALSNMSCERLEIDLGKAIKETAIESLIQRRLYRLNGKIHYQDAVEANLHKIPVEAEETTIVILRLTDDQPMQKPVLKTTHFAKNIAATITPDSRIIIQVPQAKISHRHAFLNIGLHRKGGLPATIPFVFNGKKLILDTAHAMNHKEYMGTLTFPISPDMLKTTNQLSISLPEKTTLTSAHITVKQ